MDQELRFISSLLNSSPNDQAKFYASRIPLSVFSLRGREMQWIYSFRDSHGCYPAPYAFAKKFEPLRKIKAPYTATLEPVLDAAMFSQLRGLNLKVRDMLEDGTSVAKVMSFFKGASSKLSQYSHSHVDIDTNRGEGADRSYRYTVAAMTAGGRGLIDSPWPTFNRVMPYCRPGERITVSARSSMGKSWIVAHWSEYWAQKGIRTGIFTKEMPAEDFVDRIECIRYGLSYPEFISGDLPAKVLRRWRSARANESREIPLYIFGNESQESIDYNTVAAKVREYRLDAVWVDGAYLIRPSELPANVGDTQRFMYLSNRSKEMAKMLNVVWGTTIQDNRTAEGKDGIARGSATSAFGSDAWLQDSDVMMSVNGKRGGPDREMHVSKVRKSDLVDFSFEFKLHPRPNFSDKGPSQFSPAKEAKIEKAQAKFTPLK